MLSMHGIGFDNGLWQREGTKLRTKGGGREEKERPSLATLTFSTQLGFHYCFPHCDDLNQ